MSLYNDLNEVLTPYAAKIKEVNESLGDLQDEVDNISVTTDTTLTHAGEPADAKTVGDLIGDISTAIDAINGEAV